MSAAKKLELISESEFLARELVAEVRSEYREGYVYAMAGGNNYHSLLKKFVLKDLDFRLADGPCIAWDSDTMIRIRHGGRTRFYYPDVSVICRPNPGTDSFHDRPVLIVEVLSKSTRRYDEGEKRDAYLTIPSLQYYLLLEPDRPHATVYRRVDADFAVEVFSGIDGVVPLPKLGIELTLGPLYSALAYDAGAADQDQSE